MNWTFRKKIFVGYGVSLALVVIVFAWAVISLFDLGEASESILRENYKSILAAENMIDTIERQDSAILLMLLGFGEEWFPHFRYNENLFLQWLGRAKDNITIDGESDILVGIEDNYTAFLGRVDELLTQQRTDAAAAKSFYHRSVHPLFRAILEGCIQLRELNQRTMFQASRRAQHIARRAVFSVAVIGLASIAAGLLWSIFLSNRLSRPIRRLREAALKMAEGDYQIEIPVAGRDELGLLTEQFNTMAQKVWYYNEFNIGRIQAEKLKSEAILQSVDDGIVVLDEELIVTDINPMAARIFGTKAAEATGRHLLESLDNETVYAAAKKALETGRPSKPEGGDDVISIPIGPGVGHFQFSAIPVSVDDAPLKSVVLLLRDVTRLREMDRLKSEFVMTASHELKTPLMSLGMSLDLLAESAPAKIDQRDQELLDAAREDAERLKALIRDLLDLSKLESGKVDMDFTATRVGLLFEKALAVMTPQAEQRQIELSEGETVDLPRIKADPNKIVWILVNLIANALRYTNPGGHVRLSAEAMGPQVHLSVSDDGQGIPYEYQSKIFDKFIQVGTDRDVSGTGLGLAICKEIVHAHGGTIWVESTPGEKTIFTFSLPVAEETGSQASEPQKSLDR